MPELKKTLGFWSLLALSFTSVMGSGVFFGVAIGTEMAGNVMILSWIAISLVALYIAASFSELSAMFPKTGGTYEFAKQAYGRSFSFVIGWITWLVGNITVVVLVVAAIDYLLPVPGLGTLKLLVCLFFIILLNVITYVGVEASSVAVSSFAVITVILIITIIWKALPMLNPGHFTPFFTHSIFAALGAVFFLAESFFGWESVTFLAEETKDPEKNIPRALMLGTLAVAVLGLLLFISMLGVIPWQELAGTAAPVAIVSEKVFGPAMKDIMSLGVYIMLIGAAAGGIVALPRLVLGMARDKLFLSQFSHIHPVYKTPSAAVVFQTIAIIAILFIGFANYETLLSLLLPLAIIMYMFILLAVPVLRHRQPNTKRPFKVPFATAGSIAVILFFLLIMGIWIGTQPNALNLLMLSISLVLLGFPLYFLVEMYYDPKMITDINDIFANFTFLTERVSLPPWIRQSILNFLGDATGKTLLEFGCSVGTLTVPLLEAVGSQGTVYATCFSLNDLKITKRRAYQENWLAEDLRYGRLKIIHDLEHMSRLHPDIRYADAAVSVGMLGYLQDVKKVLLEVRRILPISGKICFVEYSDYFHIIPNVEWLSNNRSIESVFRECGFSVKVIRKKGLLWNTLFIYGMKHDTDMVYI